MPFNPFKRSTSSTSTATIADIDNCQIDHRNCPQTSPRHILVPSKARALLGDESPSRLAFRGHPQPGLRDGKGEKSIQHRPLILLEQRNTSAQERTKTVPVRPGFSWTSEGSTFSSSSSSFRTSKRPPCQRQRSRSDSPFHSQSSTSAQSLSIHANDSSDVYDPVDCHDASIGITSVHREASPLPPLPTTSPPVVAYFPRRPIPVRRASSLDNIHVAHLVRLPSRTVQSVRLTASSPATDYTNDITHGPSLERVDELPSIQDGASITSETASSLDDSTNAFTHTSPAAFYIHPNVGRNSLNGSAPSTCVSLSSGTQQDLPSTPSDRSVISSSSSEISSAEDVGYDFPTPPAPPSQPCDVGVASTCNESAAATLGHTTSFLSVSSTTVNTTAPPLAPSAVSVSPVSSKSSVADPDKMRLSLLTQGWLRTRMGEFDRDEDVTLTLRGDKEVMRDVDVQLVRIEEGDEIVWELRVRGDRNERQILNIIGRGDGPERAMQGSHILRETGGQHRPMSDAYFTLALSEGIKGSSEKEEKDFKTDDGYFSTIIRQSGERPSSPPSLPCSVPVTPFLSASTEVDFDPAHPAFMCHPSSVYKTRQREVTADSVLSNESSQTARFRRSEPLTRHETFDDYSAGYRFPSPRTPSFHVDAEMKRQISSCSTDSSNLTTASSTSASDDLDSHSTYFTARETIRHLGSSRGARGTPGYVQAIQSHWEEKQLDNLATGLFFPDVGHEEDAFRLWLPPHAARRQKRNAQSASHRRAVSAWSVSDVGVDVDVA